MPGAAGDLVADTQEFTRTQKCASTGGWMPVMYFASSLTS